MKKYILFPIIFVFLLCLYAFLTKIPPIDYWDEHWWIGRSYFFDLFIRGDFRNSAWRGYYSYDQPKLAEYFYGIILYPLYLNEKAKSGFKYDYTAFLIDHNFFSSSEKKYLEYKRNTKNFINWETNVGFYYSKLSKIYGPGFQKTLNLIFYSRFFSGMLLSLSTLVVFFLLKTFLPRSLCLLISGFYSVNTVIIYGGLKANSEALFLFLFNLGLYLIIKIFSHIKISFKTLALFSILSALCTQTKLNGIMLLIIFNSLYFLLIVKVLFKYSFSKIKSNFAKIFLVNIVFFLIFTSLHPYLYKNSVRNIVSLYQWRYSVAKKNQAAFLNTGLANPYDRIFRIYKNFYYLVETNYGLPFIFYQRSYIGYENRSIFNAVKLFIRLKFLLFILGFLSLSYQSLFDLKGFFIINGKKYQTLKSSTIFYLSSIILFFFISLYLLIDHLPYFVPLVLSFYAIEGHGLFIISKLFKFTIKYANIPKKV